MSMIGQALAKSSDRHDVVLNTPRRVMNYVVGTPSSSGCSFADS